MGPKLLKNIIAELDTELRGGVVSKIHQSDGRTLILRIFIRGRDLRLLVSAHHGFPRIHLTERSYPNPPAPLRFCAFLRSRITNARIEGVRQQGLERIAIIDLAKKEGDSIEKLRLVCELTGKSSNIILIDKDDTALDALRFFPAGSLRPVQPGEKLEPLPPAQGVKEEEVVLEKGETWTDAADRFYSALVEDEEFERERAALKKVIVDNEKRLARKLSNLEGDKSRAEEGLGFYKKGELLTSVFHKLKRGMKEVEALDYTKEPPEPVRIALDEKLAPKENVERLFKRARKSKTAIALLEKRIPEVRSELDYIESLKYDWEAATDKGGLNDIREELREGGYLKEPAGKRPVKEAVQIESIRRFTSSEGFEILCGKSGLGNDLLVSKYSSGDDIWFHVKGLPGSHALIKVAGRKNEVTEKTIEEAAAIAAFYSKAKEARKAEVIFTEARNVKKPKGAKPGMVTVKEYRGVVVKPGLPEGVGNGE